MVCCFLGGKTKGHINMKLIKNVVHGYLEKRILYVVKIDLKQRSLSDFSLPDALLAWKWYTPKSEKLK